MKSKKQNEKPEPIRQSVHVDCPVEDAFRFFTEGFGKWWPLVGSGETCDIEPWVGGRVMERSSSGSEREWGAVTAWNPPGSLEFTWNPGGPKDERQTVSVEFEEDAEGTMVTLTHHGWQLAGVAVCVSDTQATSSTLVQGLVVCGVPNWKPVAIGRISIAGPIGSGRLETAWRNVTRPTWAEVFLNSFAAFAAEHSPAAV